MPDENNLPNPAADTPPDPFDTTIDTTDSGALDDFMDIVTRRLYDYHTYEELDSDDRNTVRLFATEFFQVANGVQGLTTTLNDYGFDSLPGWVQSVVARLFRNTGVGEGSDAALITQDYARLLVQNTPAGEANNILYIELRANKIDTFLQAAYRQMTELDAAQADLHLDETDLIREALKGFGSFKPNLEYLEIRRRFEAELLDRPGKFRGDTTPASIKPWQCRIGASTFLVPPINVVVNQEFYTNSLTGGAIRQQNSPKTNLGNSDTNISMTLLFPNHESIWGFSGDRANLDIFNWDPKPYRVDSPVFGQSRIPGDAIPDSVIDYYLSSLRGLITEFKYSPILPVRNEYLNKTFGISAVTLNSLTMSTVENFPFVISVTLNMKKFNYKPFLPMIQDFDQAIHWGRFRQYMGRAASALDQKVNEGFLTQRADWDYLSASEKANSEAQGNGQYSAENNTNIPVFNKITDFNRGRMDFYFPQTTPSRIFAPDTTDFRQVGEDEVITEDIWDGFLSNIGLDLVSAPKFNFEEYSNARTSISSERQLVLDFLKANSDIYTAMSSDQLNKFIEQKIKEGHLDGSVNSSNESFIRTKLLNEWYFTAFDSFMSSNDQIAKAKETLKSDQQYQIKEWEVPMDKLYIDWSNCIIQGISVNLTNNFAPMRVQGLEDPTFQHIGGGDSTLSVSMIVLGEDNLARFRRMFTHINGLARLERGHGVLGFLGVKNVFTALAGIKYLLPLSFEVSNRDNVPHAYDVRMSFVDFDVMQQKREELSNDMQRQLVEVFGKRNPFLRLKQLWANFNGYPDMPLDVKDVNGELLGYMDPDWYFRSFVPRDKDTYEWGINERLIQMVVQYNQYDTALNQLNTSSPTSPQEVASRNQAIGKLRDQLALTEAALQQIFEETGELLPGYTIEGGTIKRLDPDDEDFTGQVQQRQYLGVYGENNEKGAYIDFFNGGMFRLGIVDTATGEEKNVLRMSAFRDDLASINSKGVPSLTIGTAEYQNEHFDGTARPNKQFETMMQDFDYRNLKGRMLRAYPTYMLWLIDEGGRFAGIKLFDNFYGLNSVIDFAVHQSEDAVEDTLVLTLSNIYQKLTTPYRETLISEDNPLYETPIGQWITTQENRNRNLVQGMTDALLELNNIRLKPGVRVHLRAGYGCADTQTEILTQDGWKKYDEIEIGQKVLTLNHETGLSEWALVENMNIYDVHDEEMLLIDGKSHSSLTTLNHRWPILHRDFVETYENGKRYSHYIGDSRKWTTSDNIKTTNKFVCGAINNDIPKEQKWEDALVELIGWFWTEGHIKNIGTNRNPMVTISQSHTVNPENVLLIRSSLTRLFGPASDSLGTGGRWSRERSPTWRERTRPLPKTETEFILNTIAAKVLLDHAPNRIVSTEFIKQLTYAQLELFIQISNKGDGHLSRSEVGICISQKNPDALEAFELAAILAGYRTHKWLDNEVTYDRLGNPYHRTKVKLGKIKTLGFTDVKRETIKYSGIIWCPTTKNETWLSRRNGHVSYTGNSNPNGLQTIFNGTIAEVQQGEMMTVICQSDAVELTGMVNSSDSKGDSGRLQGGINTGFWMSEPRDLIVRLLSMGSSYFKEWVSWGTKGVFFSESKFGIRHFGSILYESMTPLEREGHRAINGAAISAATAPATGYGQDPAVLQGVLGDKVVEAARLENITGVPGLIDGNLFKLAGLMWANTFAHRDYELFKRNIYPGNGTGIAQFMGGDMIDGGLLMNQADASVGLGEDSAPSSQGLTPSFWQRIFNDGTTTVQPISEQTQLINDIWNEYGDSVATALGVTGISAENRDEELLAALGDPSTSTLDLSNLEPKNEGIFEQLWENDWVRGIGLAGLTFAFGPGALAGRGLVSAGIKIGSMLFTSGFLDKLNLEGLADAVHVGGIYDVVDFLLDFRRPVNTVVKLAHSPIGQIMGLTSAVDDDDIEGYDEVSFRAQTYMKTVWDLFKVCAALLPNYIVAVRPFEDRSTLFYGKPHWLYTSGVVPISQGIGKDPTLRPLIEEHDDFLSQLIDQFTRNSSPEATLNKLIDEEGLLKDIKDYKTEIDPNGEGEVTKYHNDLAPSVVADFITAEFADGSFGGFNITDDKGYSKEEILTFLTDYDFSPYDNDQITAILDDFQLMFQLNEDEPDETLVRILNRSINNIIHGDASNPDTPTLPDPISGEDIVDQWNINEGDWNNELVQFEDASHRLNDLAAMDPVAFAYQFGWKFSSIPVYLAPSSGFGEDQVGTLARRMYDEDFDPTSDVMGDGRGLEMANDIWHDLRTNDFRDDEELLSIWASVFPTTGFEGGFAPDTGEQNDVVELPGPGAADPFSLQPQSTTQPVVGPFSLEPTGTVTTDLNGAVGNTAPPARFSIMLDMFIRFLWQDPWNRAWVVRVVSRDSGDWKDFFSDFSISFHDQNPEWKWDALIDLWTEFIHNPITFNENGVPQSAAGTKWMESHNTAGKDASNPIAGIIEGAGDWVSQNLGQLLAVVGDSLTGFVSSIRLSLSQMGNALSMSGEMQRQSSMLNALFDDSIYYRAGDEGSLERLADNPFTREYGEPVVEIREPFQRVHFISSFDSILSNGITENLTGVATTVTAVSDGKYPVKVHLDKGIPPDRQTELIVETGIYWDNAFGTGLFGIFHPLLHPFETARSFSKAALGSSDQLTSRRIALSHLKNSVKNIYTGEVIVTGDPDIRPFDMVYIADVTERMYGMFEVASVRHNFSPTTGFTTHITPNAIVTVNDPARWTMLSYMWSKMTSYNMRDDVRTSFAVTTDSNLANVSKEITRDDVYKLFGVQMNGSIQYTQGSTAIIKDIGSAYTGGGIDDLWNGVGYADMAIGLGRGLMTIGGIGLGTLFGGPTGAVAAGATGFVAGKLAWEAWEWVKDNLLDQHGCYVQFLNKDGQPMDAGLSYYQGLAVGSNHTVDLFPNVLGITSPKATLREDGHYRITTNDLLGALGWNEVDTLALHRESSMYVNSINSNILQLANRVIEPVNAHDTAVMTARVNPNGYFDGDTFEVSILDGAGGAQSGATERIRFSSINTPEIPHNAEDEAIIDSSEARGFQARDYVIQRFANVNDQIIAIRVNPRDLRDDTSSHRIVGVIFHNAPLGTLQSDRAAVLKEIASREPLVPWDTYLEDGRPYTLNWEMVMTGYGNVYMNDRIWDTDWREQALAQ